MKTSFFIRELILIIASKSVQNFKKTSKTYFTNLFSGVSTFSIFLDDSIFVGIEEIFFDCKGCSDDNFERIGLFINCLIP
jgi:hypothetical protein